MARRVAARGHGRQEQEGRLQVVEEDEEDRGQADAESTRRARAAASGRSGHGSGESIRRTDDAARDSLARRRWRRRWKSSTRAAGPGPVLSVEAAEPVLDGGERGGQVAAAVLVVQGQLAQGQPVSALRRLLPIARPPSPSGPAFFARAARRRSDAVRTGPGPARAGGGTAPPSARRAPRAPGRGPGNRRRAGPPPCPPSTHWQASAASAARERTSSRLCSSTRAMARPSRRRTKSK